MRYRPPRHRAVPPTPSPDAIPTTVPQTDVPVGLARVGRLTLSPAPTPVLLTVDPAALDQRAA